MSWTPPVQGAGKLHPMNQVWPDAHLCKYSIYWCTATPIPGTQCLWWFWPPTGRAWESQQKPSTPKKPKMFILGPPTANELVSPAHPRPMRNWTPWQCLSWRTLQTHLSVRNLCTKLLAYVSGASTWTQVEGAAPSHPSPTSTGFCSRAESDCSFDKFQIGGRDATKHEPVTVP